MFFRHITKLQELKNQVVHSKFLFQIHNCSGYAMHCVELLSDLRYYLQITG